MAARYVSVLKWNQLTKALTSGVSARCLQPPRVCHSKNAWGDREGTRWWLQSGDQSQGGSPGE